MAMSQRTPSHAPAIDRAHRASRPGVPGWRSRAGACPASPEKYGSRPCAQQQSPAARLDPDVVLRLLQQVRLGPGDEVVRVLVDPRMVERRCGWARNRAADGGRAGAAARAVGASAASPPSVGRDGVPGDANAGARDVLSRRSGSVALGIRGASPGSCATPAARLARLHTLRNQTQSKPVSANASSSASGTSSSVAGRPRRATDRSARRGC